MTDILAGSEAFGFSSALKLVKTELFSSLEQAAAHLDALGEQNNPEMLRAFLEEVQQLRGTFKMLNFRVGERLCEELAETGRALRNQPLTLQTLGAFTQAILYLKRYLDLASQGEPLAPSLLVPTLNVVRKERKDVPLPEAYFFIANLRPQIAQPTPVAVDAFPYRRARQLFQLGLLGLIRGNGRRGPLVIMSRAVRRFEQLSRGNTAWLFWYVVSGALEALAQEKFEMTAQRLSLLGALDRQVRRVQDLESKAFLEKAPDWLLKEFLYLVAIAEPDSNLLQRLQQTFQVTGEIRETKLALVRARLNGPDQSALDSLAQALQEELQSIKDLVDIFERTDINEQNFNDLCSALNRIADTLVVANLAQAQERTRTVLARVKKQGMAGVKANLVPLADDILQIEQDVRTLTQTGLDKKALVDPLSLKEARIALVGESLAALGMVKRAISSYIDSNNDKLHINNIGKNLVDVAGAMMFLENAQAYKMLLEMDRFIRKQVLEASNPPTQASMEAFADAISAIEYYLDSIDIPGAGAEDALKLVVESVKLLRG